MLTLLGTLLPGDTLTSTLLPGFACAIDCFEVISKNDWTDRVSV